MPNPKIIATNKSGAVYEPVEAGNYVARCVKMIHMGTITEDYQGTPKTANKVQLTWELPTEVKVFKEADGEQPYVLSKEFTLSMHEKASLRKWLEAWRGKGFTNAESEAFDITNLVGKPCMLNVIHTTKGDRTYANISGVSSMPKGLTCPPQVNDSIIFSVNEFDQILFDSFPDFIKEKIRSSAEYKAMQQPNHVNTTPEPAFTQDDNETPDDGLPF